jgi:hypothetical protein
MNSKHFFPVLLFLSLLNLTVWGQNSKAIIEFASNEYDFGNIDGSKGLVDCEFTFFNKGTLPLVLSGVKASCGCTSPDWTKEPVMPGKSGMIKVSYNPSGVSGFFNKSITVSSNADNGEATLRVKGNVLNAVTHDDIFKHTIGDIKLSAVHVSFGSVIK